LQKAPGQKELIRGQVPVAPHDLGLLEGQIGATLFHRTRHEVHLTPLGRDLLGRVRPLLAELVDTLAAAERSSKGIAGSITVGSLQEIGQSRYMAPMLAFRKNHPALDLRVEYGAEESIIRQIREGALNFGIMTTAPFPEHFSSYSLGEETIILATARSNQHDLNDAGIPEFVTYRSEDRLLKRFLKSPEGRRFGQRHRVVVAVNSHRSMVDALKSSNAFCVLPRHSIAKELESGELRVASSWSLRSKLFLTCLENTLIERRLRLFKEFMILRSRS
jgi:DNA-binding transcriptional LysR family regulator